jgi:hypothetical protein
MFKNLAFTRYVGSYYSIGLVDAVQLTRKNYGEVEEWLKENGSDIHYWTNESLIIGFWVFNTWHDRHDKTPVPFGWWVYLSDSGMIGAASEGAIDEHYTLASR